MPQPFNNAIMTNSGANLLLRAQFGEIKIEFTRMAIGNGVYEDEEKSLDALQERTELKSEKNSYGLSNIHIHTGKSIKLTALITNQDPVTEETLIEEGYYINEIGLFAKERDNDDSQEVLYSIAVTSGGNGDFMPPYNGFNPAEIIQDYYVTVNNSAEVTIKSNMGVPALADDLQALYGKVEQNKAEMQSNLAQQQMELMGYTDTKVSELVDSAPEDLDTLKEVAEAIKENENVVTALNSAIGTKQNKLGIGTFTKNIDILGDGGLPQTSSICWCQSTELQGTLPYESDNAYWFVLETKVTQDNRPGMMRSQKATVWGQENNRVFERIFTNGEWYAWKEYLRTDGDLKDITVSFTSGDDLNPTGWTAIGKIFSGAKLKDILNGFSTGIKNLRYLWKLCGENDISGLADGTITGVLSQLNTDISTFGNRYTRINVEGNSYRKLTFVGFFCAIISLIGQDSFSQGTFVAQGYGIYQINAPRISIATIQATGNVSCEPVEGEEAVQFTNTTANVRLIILMLEGGLPKITV